LPSVADELNLDETDGVVIVAVRKDGIAARLGFQPGDIIIQVGDEKIHDVVSLDKITRKPQRLWRIAIKRGGRVMQLQLSG
jgi:C-terminal processing protease CtpA/Prc